MISRRRFLTGLSGAVLGLPLLESVAFDKPAYAAAGDNPIYSVFVRQGNGVAQRLDSRGEPERFWPRSLGQITQASLGGVDADRAVGELAAYADQLLMVRGTRFGFSPEGCGHTGGINQCLTAGQVTLAFEGEEGRYSLSGHESIDWRIAQDCNPPGVEPLTLMAGPQDAYIAAGLSYTGPRQLRGADNNPFAVYVDMVGLGGEDVEVVNEIANRRISVNDLVRDEMQDLLGNSRLGSADRRLLQTHFEAVRDMEIQMTCGLSSSEIDAMRDIQDAVEDNDVRLDVAMMHMNLIALAFSCDLNRTATLQIGTGNDQTRFYVDGQLQNTFHRISHRIDSDGSEGPEIPNADLLHHEIDRMFARTFRHLLDRLSMYTGPSGGTLLDDGFALWTNDLANGPPHSTNNVPQIIAGSAGGFLRQGEYVDAGNVTHNKFLNTLLNAVGLRNEDGSLYDSFGDDSLEPGVVPEMMA